MSLHRSDWLKLLGGAAMAMTGLGAAGIGPLAGLLASGAATGAGTAGAAGAAAAAGGAGAGAGLGAAGLGAGVDTLGAGLGAAGGAGAAGASFGSLVAPSLVGTGLSTAESGAMGTPTETMTTPGNVPQMTGQTDPFSMFAQIMNKSKGGGF